MNSLKKFAVVALAVLGVTITSVTPGSAAAYIKFDGIDGEAVGARTDPARGIDLGDPTRRIAALVRNGDEAGELVFRREHDRASPLLARWAEEGRRFRTLTVYVPTSGGYGGSRATYLKYELTNVRVTSWSTSGDTATGDADDRPTEEVAFYYNRISLVADDTTPTRSRR